MGRAISLPQPGVRDTGGPWRLLEAQICTCSGGRNAPRLLDLNHILPTTYAVA